MKKTIITIVLFVTLFLFGCDNASNPIQSAGTKDKIVKESDTTLVYFNNAPIALTTNRQSETTQLLDFGILDFTRATNIKVEFDYLVINTQGLAGNNLQLITENRNIFIIGTLPTTNYVYVHYNNTFTITENNIPVHFRQTIQYNCLVFSINNLIIKKY